MTVNIIEGSERTSVDVCDLRQREKEIYVSTTNHILLEVSYPHNIEQTPHFLLRYKGTGTVLVYQAVADPGFPVGGGVDLVGGAMDPQGGYVLKILHVKTKESGPVGGARAGRTPPPRSANARLQDIKPHDTSTI